MVVMQILVIVAIIAFSAYSSSRKEKAKRQAAGRPSVPPPLPEDEEVDDYDTEALLRAAEQVDNGAVPLAVREAVRPAPPVRPRRQVAKPRPVTDRPRTEEAVRLDSPAKARRAFIYSEIFNRKY